MFIDPETGEELTAEDAIWYDPNPKMPCWRDALGGLSKLRKDDAPLGIMDEKGAYQSPFQKKPAGE